MLSLKTPTLHLSNWQTATGKFMICNDVNPPKRPSFTRNPYRFPLSSQKLQWEREWEKEREEKEPAMLVRWEAEMKGDALVSFHQTQKLRETLYHDYMAFPFDMKALMMRLQITELTKRYPEELELFFLGDWDYYCDLEEDIEKLQEEINSLLSQKHLEEHLQRLEALQKEQYFQGILIGCKRVPRIHMGYDHMPEDHDENLEDYQKPSEPTKKEKKKIAKRLFCKEGEKKEEKDRWQDVAEMHVEIPIVPRKSPEKEAEERRDPHQIYFEMIYKDISDEFIEDFFLSSSPLNSPSSPSPKKRKLENPIGYFSPFSPSF